MWPETSFKGQELLIATVCVESPQKLTPPRVSFTSGLRLESTKTVTATITFKNLPLVSGLHIHQDVGHTDSAHGLFQDFPKAIEIFAKNGLHAATNGTQRIRVIGRKHEEFSLLNSLEDFGQSDFPRFPGEDGAAAGTSVVLMRPAFDNWLRIRRMTTGFVLTLPAM